jgi:hypothetical protein
MSFVLLVACSDDGRGGNTTAATSVTTAPVTTTSTTGDATTTGVTATGATSTAAPTSGSGGESSSGTSGGSSATGSTGSSSGEATTAAVKLDVGVVPDLGGGDTDGNCSSECESDQAGQFAGDWLLHIDGSDLYRVDVAGGNAVLLCENIGAANTLTFTRDNRLFSTSGNSLRQVDPCTCTDTVIGPFPNEYASIYGIAPDEGNELFGFSAQADALVRIDTQTAQTTEVGKVGFAFAKHGAAWSEQDQILYFVTDSTLYRVDIQTGLATEIGPLGVDFGDVGVEQHPATARLYGCTGDGNLYEIDKGTGAATLIGPLGTGSDCTNLGAPWTETEVCLPIPG